MDVSKLPPDVRELVYRPPADAEINTEIEFPARDGFGNGDEPNDATVINIDLNK